MPKQLDPPTCAPDPIWDATLAPYHLPTLLVADEIGLFPFLAGRPATAAEVAEHYRMAPHAAEALLGVLSAKGHLAQHGGKFHLTESSLQFLLPSSPYYCGPALELRRNRPIDHTILKEILFRERAGDAPVVFDTRMWQATDEYSERLKASTASMHALFFPAAMAVALYADMTGVQHLLDIAAGSGCFSIALAKRYPEMRLTALDLPPVCALLKAYAQEYDVAARIAVVGGDMFADKWPDGPDAHFFSNVFHDWDANTCSLLAAKSFAALPTGGRIFLHESLLNETRDGPSLMPLYSMNMARMTENGKQYSASELQSILTGAGFSDVRVRHTWSIFSVVSARKP